MTQFNVTETDSERSRTPKAAEISRDKIKKIVIGLSVPLGFLLIFLTIWSFVCYKRNPRQKGTKGAPSSKDSSGDVLPSPDSELTHQIPASQRDTMISPVSIGPPTAQERRLSELMSSERVELNGRTLG
jgi:hypothetical protein